MENIGKLAENIVKNLKMKQPNDEKPSKNSKYPDFVESTGYGTGGGLCGWNCRHNFIPFEPEFMKNNLEVYDLQENEKVYKLTQKQRLFERNIRKLRRKVQLENLAKTDDLQESNTKLKKLIKNYKIFCKKNDLKPQFERTEIGTE